eukprot:4643874-Karenia_brevis.AAC.1
MEDEADQLYQQESWVDWMRRRTHLAESILSSLKIDDWITLQRRRKFAFAGHMLRRRDNRWAATLMRWTPEGGHRTRGHPRRRWSDVFDKFFWTRHGASRGEWHAYAADRTLWYNLESDFAYFALNRT